MVQSGGGTVPSVTLPEVSHTFLCASEPSASPIVELMTRLNKHLVLSASSIRTTPRNFTSLFNHPWNLAKGFPREDIQYKN
jgi:hypothetical protein